MSRGPGRVQQAVIDLIRDDPDSAWTVSDLCKIAYPGTYHPNKKQRVAVLRALRKMKMAGTWRTKRMAAKGGEYCLYDPCNLESEIRSHWYDGCRHQTLEEYKANYPKWVDQFRKNVERAQRRREVDQLTAIDIEIEEAQDQLRMYRMLEYPPDVIKAAAAEIQKMQDRREAIIAERKAAA